ncbi:urea ABC transporter ATP-binding protein UrtD [cf. Phormidesmis sp. LEGE 11477]|uniref:urea ABC transporter ATP-binding protein UrtD n=1 Tax=cf. Phormidesmis sp. LEGE 11477 TaxID=1828680 RepID=UPI001882C377|nr:urea ABC transporter ATP-binding protein UrtD [cf. Phormidesmis sp. LEGE 11477]MBE9062554.1 urea ABC transporter ATP-binding protein UrtD [cf. Phormidesmis sp. LEGE 11477]
MKAVLSVKDLNVVFSGFKALSGVNLDVYDGEIVTIIGPNGAGKSTLLDAIVSKSPVASGKVFFNGKDITNRQPYTIARMGIGRKFQNPNVYNELTVFDNILLALKGAHGIFSAITAKLTKAKKGKIYDVLERTGLIDQAFEEVSSLSHGQKQWVEIAMVLAQDPSIVLLDEPTAGMTAEETFATGEIIKSIAKSHSIVVIEHDMEFVKQIAERIVVLHQGAVLAEGSVEEVQSNPKVIEVYLGRETINAAA